MDIYQDEKKLKNHITRVMYFCTIFAHELSNYFEVDIGMLYLSAYFHDIARLDEVGEEHNKQKIVKASLKKRHIRLPKEMRLVIEAHKDDFESPSDYVLEAAILRISDKLDKFNKGQDNVREKCEKSMNKIKKCLKENGYTERQIERFRSVYKSLLPPETQ